MDYPKSVPSAGLVDGSFVDEDPLNGRPGSLIPASWGNGVTQEILSVVQAGGLTPSEASNTQMLGALRSAQLSGPPHLSISAVRRRLASMFSGLLATTRGRVTSLPLRN